MIKAGINVKTSFAEAFVDPNFTNILLEVRYPSTQNATANPPEAGDLFCDPGAIYDRIYAIVGTPVRDGVTNDFLCSCTLVNETPTSLGQKPVISSGGAITTPNRNGFATHFDDNVVSVTAALKASGYNTDYKGAEDPSMPVGADLSSVAGELETARGTHANLNDAVVDKVSKTVITEQQILSDLRCMKDGGKVTAPSVDTRPHDDV